jgi:uncharacterized protein
LGGRHMDPEGEEDGSDLYELVVDPNVRIHPFREVDLVGAKVIDGFPSVGLVSTIVANYLIDMLKLEQIGIVDARHFPTLSVVHNGEPLNPVRIYAGEHKDKKEKTQKIVVFISEFQLAPPLVRPVAEAMVEWCRSHKASLIISPEGIVLEEGDELLGDDVEVYAIGTTPEAQKLIKRKKLPVFTHGIITGVSGMLLNIGRREHIDVVSLLAEAHANYPDARSAAAVIESIAKLLDIEINVAPLYKEAEGFERQIRQLRRQMDFMERGHPSSPSMYG